MQRNKPNDTCPGIRSLLLLLFIMIIFFKPLDQPGAYKKKG